MADLSTYPLRLPKSLKDKVAKVARQDGSSINQFITIAVAEKISVLETGQFFLNKMSEADLDAFRSLLFRSGGEPPRAGDELP